MFKEKPMLFKLLFYFILMTVAIVACLSTFPYLSMRKAFNEQFLISKQGDFDKANRQISFLINNLNRMHNKINNNSAVRSVLTRQTGDAADEELIHIKEQFTTNSYLHDLNQYDVYIIGTNEFRFHYSSGTGYTYNIDMPTIGHSIWYQQIWQNNGAGLLINGANTDLPRVSSRVIYGQTLTDESTAEPLGVMLVFFKKSVLNDTVAKILADDTTSFYIADELGIPIRPVDDKMRLSPQILAEAKAANRNVLTHKDAQVLLINITNTDWTIVEILDYTFLKAPANALIITVGIIGILVLVMASAIAYWLLNQLYRPINQLNGAMKQIEQGDYDIDFLPTDQTNEIGTLNKSLIKMTKALRESFENLYQEQKQKRTAEIKMLQAQIQPHFLYNTLTSIRALIRMDKKDDADMMIVSLIKLLKNTLNMKDLITIAEELELLRYYQNIYTYRYQNFRIVFEVDHDLLQYYIPKFALQPLVENSIAHNLNHSDFSLDLAISIRRCEERIIIEITDNGKGFSREYLDRVRENGNRVVIESDSVGLRNVANRITTVFGNDYGLFIDSGISAGARVWLEIPPVTAIE